VVYVFFCVGGVHGALLDKPSPMTRDEWVPTARSLTADISKLAETLGEYPGAVVVVGNAWPLYYDLSCIREVCGELGRRVVNVVSTLGHTLEEAVLDFMESRSEQFVILSSTEFEFSDLTAAQRVNIDTNIGFDEMARIALVKQLQEFGQEGKRSLTEDDLLRAIIGGHALRRARRLISQIRAAEDLLFQRTLRSLVGGK
jgi:hypothetical protein